MIGIVNRRRREMRRREMKRNVNRMLGWGRKCSGMCGVRCVLRYMLYCYSMRKWMCWDCWDRLESEYNKRG